MLETLTTTAEQVEKAEPISAHPDKLRDQISDNVAIIEDLDKRLSALESVASTAEDLLNQTGMDDESAKGMCEIYQEYCIWANTEMVYTV